MFPDVLVRTFREIPDIGMQVHEEAGIMELILEGDAEEYFCIVEHFAEFVGIMLLAISLQGFAQQPFDAKAFKAVQRTGAPILVEIHADWCESCQAQAPILEKLFADPKYSRIARFRVDFDSQTEIATKFRVHWLSTLVLYKGNAEVARSIGELKESRIRAMLAKAL